MSSLLRPRITCFYCNSKSPHRKGDGTRNFRCSNCEGTNYLDKNGNIIDVPTEITDANTNVRQQYATARPGSVSPPGRTNASEDSIFCAQCLKNQRFLADCLANYLPAESDPRYAEFEQGYPAYKKSLEQRYPPVCTRCEPRVRARLKQTSYAAKTDILAKSLGRGITAWSGPSKGPLWNLIVAPGLLVAELAWIFCLAMQAVCHVIAFRYNPWDDMNPAVRATGYGKINLASCTFRGLLGRPLHATCSPDLSNLWRLSLLGNTLLLWWNPALLRLSGRKVANTMAYYQFQVASFAIRFAIWTYLTGTVLHPDLQVRKALHLIALILVVSTAIVPYRIIRPAPRPKIQFRKLDTPLVDKGSMQYPQADHDPNSPRAPVTPTRFNVSNLSHRDSSPMPRTSQPAMLSGITRTPGRALLQHNEPLTSSEDAMDWEPLNTQTHNLRPRSRGTTPAPAPLYPSTSAFSGRPTANGPSPFHGTLPAAPRSLEARLRTAAQQQPARFKPATDAKQADWFKRMHLSQASWASKDYVTSVDDPNKRTLELRDPQLDLNMLGLGGSTSKDGGTGLEDFFGASFRLDDDDSPAREQVPDLQETSDDRSAIFWWLIVIASIPFIYGCVIYILSPGETTRQVQSVWQRVQELGYGH